MQVSNCIFFPPPMATCHDSVSDNAKTSCIGCGTLANGMHAKQPLPDRLKELAVEDGFKKTRNSTVSAMISKQQRTVILTTFQPHHKVHKRTDNGIHSAKNKFAWVPLSGPSHLNIQCRWLTWVEQQRPLCELHHIINAANNLPLEAEYISQIEPYITISKQMMNQHEQQIKLFPLERVTSLTQEDALLSDLKLFYLWNYIIDGGGACWVSTQMDAIPLHGAKRHEMGDCILMECKGFRSFLSKTVIGRGVGMLKALLLRQVATWSAVIANSRSREDDDVPSYCDPSMKDIKLMRQVA